VTGDGIGLAAPIRPAHRHPLAATPAKTGDNLILWVLAAGASGIGLVWVSLLGKKRRDEDGSQN